MKLILAGLIAGASLMVATSSAMAAIATYTAPNYAALAINSTVIPDGTISAAPIRTVDEGGIVLSPFSGQAGYGAGFYAAGPAAGTVPNPAIVLFNSVKDTFNFLWGSPDTYNDISFYNAGGFVTTLASLLPGFNYTQSGAVYVTVSGLLFNEVRFGSSSQAVEFSSISTVPVPAGLPLLGAGLAFLGYLGMRRKRNAAVAA